MLFISSNNDFFNHLKYIFKRNNLNKYIDNENFLNKNVIIDDLNNYDSTLLSILMNDKWTIHCYAKQINGQFIFNFESLKSSLQYKNFWKDSYTKFSNKIGLSSNGKFIDNNSKVVLDFPFKDTVLKGSMTEENESKGEFDESFLNDVIAHPEIDEMFEPKVLVNSKKYDKNGKHNISDFSDKDNLIIKGNNLIALHSIKKRYSGKIKSIVIDPPYFFNKEKPADTFSYNSNFKLSTWLVFMKNRLTIAKKLLTDDGIIFITISDEGAHYLKVLADSIFGMNNFIADVTWESRKSISSDGLMSMNGNHVLIYSKNLSQINKYSFRLALDKDNFKYNDNDGRGPYRLEPFDAPNVRKNLNYTIITPSGRKLLPPKNRHWRTEENNYKEMLNNNKIYFGKNGSSKPSLKMYYSEVKDSGKGKAASTVWKDINSIIWTDAGTNTNATRHQYNMFGKGVFTNPKPEQLIQRMLELSTNKNDRVLDFFMGSATTQAVAMKMHRRFIGIEQMDYINTVSVPRLQKVIAGEQGGISKDVNWRGGESFIYAELMNKNNQYIKEINNAKNIDELNNVYESIKKQTGFNINIQLSKFEQEKDKYSFEDQKELLVQMLDKNQLYYNYHNIDDNNIKKLLSEKDYKFNKQFYNNGE